MIAIILSVGAINALIPVIVIVVLIAAAAGLTRGWQIFALFGISSFMGISSTVSKGTLSGKSGFKTGAFSGAKGAVQSVTKLAKTATVGEKFGSYDAKKAKDARQAAEQEARNPTKPGAQKKSWAESKLIGAGAGLKEGFKSGSEVKGGLGAIRGHMREGMATKLEEALVRGTAPANVLNNPNVKLRMQMEKENASKELGQAWKSGASPHTIHTLQIKLDRINRVLKEKNNPDRYMNLYKEYYRKTSATSTSNIEAAKNLSAAKELHIVSAPTTAAIGGVRAARNLIGGRGVNRVRDFKEMHDMLSRTQGTVYLGEETDKEGNKTGAKLFAKKISAKKALDEWKKNNYTP